MLYTIFPCLRLFAYTLISPSGRQHASGRTRNVDYRLGFYPSSLECDDIHSIEALILDMDTE